MIMLAGLEMCPCILGLQWLAYQFARIFPAGQVSKVG